MSIISFLALLTINTAFAAENWFCNTTIWRSVSGQWAYPPCGILGADQAAGAITWIGDHYKPSMSWTNYNISLTMQLLDPASDSDDNAGLLFRAKAVSNTNNGGQQYYIGISGLGILQFGKMNNGWNIFYTSPKAVCDAKNPFLLTVTAVGNKYTIYVNGTMLTTYTDNSSPYTAGSVGLRDYISTALYSNLIIDLL
eukprot:274282_1